MKLKLNSNFVLMSLCVAFATATVAQLPGVHDAVKLVDDVGKRDGVSGLHALVTVVAIAYAWWVSWTSQKMNARVISSLFKIGMNLERIAADLQSKPCTAYQHAQRHQTPSPIESITSDTPV